MKKKNVTGIIGYPLSHTLSPLMHNSVFKKKKMNWEYLVFETKPEDVGPMIKKMRKEKIKGFNVTIPHKHAVMKYLDRIDKAARQIGAVNTVANSGGKLTGYNTDHIGFMQTLKKNRINLKNKKVVMLGAGGAAHAIGYCINSMKPKEFYVFNIDMPMTENLVKKLKLKNVIMSDLKPSADKDAIFASADFVINATSVGMEGRKMPYNIKKLKKSCVVYDIIYNPAFTPFLKKAKQLGCRTINGLDMLILQGTEAFKIWTGKKSDYKLITSKLKGCFKKK